MSGTTGRIKTWNKTKIQGLVRNKSEICYARLYIGGKEKWRSLKTPLLEIAKAKIRTDETRALPVGIEPTLYGLEDRCFIR